MNQLVQQTVQQTMETVSEWQQRESERIREEVEAELHEAMENEDPKAAVAAQKKLDDLDAKPPAPQGQPELLAHCVEVGKPAADLPAELHLLVPHSFLLVGRAVRSGRR